MVTLYFNILGYSFYRNFLKNAYSNNITKNISDTYAKLSQIDLFASETLQDVQQYCLIDIL